MSRIGNKVVNEVSKMLHELEKGETITASEAFLLMHQMGHEITFETFDEKMLLIKIRDMMEGTAVYTQEAVNLDEVLKIAEACQKDDKKGTKGDQPDEEGDLAIIEEEPEKEWDILE